MSRIVVVALDPGDPELSATIAALDAETVTIEGLARRLTAGGVQGVVVISDGLDPDVAVLMAGMRGEGVPPAIEVRGGRWDGFSRSPLSGACRAVISGFGMAGVAEAIGALRGEQDGALRGEQD